MTKTGIGPTPIKNTIYTDVGLINLVTAAFKVMAEAA